MDSAPWPPVVRCKTNSHRLPLAILTVSVCVAVVIVVMPRSESTQGAAAQGAAGPSREETSTSEGPGSMSATKAVDRAAGRPGSRSEAGSFAAGGGLQRGDPPALALPNKFERAKFEAPIYPDYALTEDSRVETQAIIPEGPAPRVPSASSEMAEWQLLEETWSVAAAEGLPEMRQAEANE